MKFNFSDTLKSWLPFSVDTKERDAIVVKSFNFRISDKFNLRCQLALQLVTIYIGSALLIIECIKSDTINCDI